MFSKLWMYVAVNGIVLVSVLLLCVPSVAILPWGHGLANLSWGPSVAIIPWDLSGVILPLGHTVAILPQGQSFHILPYCHGVSIPVCLLYKCHTKWTI